MRVWRKGLWRLISRPSTVNSSAGTPTMATSPMASVWIEVVRVSPWCGAISARCARKTSAVAWASPRVPIRLVQ